MASVEERLSTLGLALPKPMVAPPGVVLPFQSVRIIDDRALISGHGPQNPDGSIAGPLGKLGRELTVEQGTSPRASPRCRSSAASSARSGTSTG